LVEIYLLQGEQSAIDLNSHHIQQISTMTLIFPIGMSGKGARKWQQTQILGGTLKKNQALLANRLEIQPRCDLSLEIMR
jgi:hypothetical protein